MQLIEQPKWKWKHITMDFIVDLSKARRKMTLFRQWQTDLPRLTKTSHFIPYHVGYMLEEMVTKYMKEIVRLHGVPISIISNRDPRFIPCFWENFQEAMGSKLKLSTTFLPQTERKIQILKDIVSLLRVCAINFKGGWEK